MAAHPYGCPAYPAQDIELSEAIGAAGSPRQEYRGLCVRNPNGFQEVLAAFGFGPVPPHRSADFQLLDEISVPHLGLSTFTICGVGYDARCNEIAYLVYHIEKENDVRSAHIIKEPDILLTACGVRSTICRSGLDSEHDIPYNAKYIVKKTYAAVGTYLYQVEHVGSGEVGYLWDEDVEAMQFLKEAKERILRKRDRRATRRTQNMRRREPMLTRLQQPRLPLEVWVSD